MNEPFPLNLFIKVAQKDLSLGKTLFFHFSESLFQKNISLILYENLESTLKSDDHISFEYFNVNPSINLYSWCLITNFDLNKHAFFCKFSLILKKIATLGSLCLQNDNYLPDRCLQFINLSAAPGICVFKLIVMTKRAQMLRLP